MTNFEHWKTNLTPEDFHYGNCTNFSCVRCPARIRCTVKNNKNNLAECFLYFARWAEEEYEGNNV
jgi:hypothetical protein